MSVASRPHPVTVVSIAIVACAAADVVHEVVGHGTASMVVGDPILSISTVALQTGAPSRLVAASGTLANVVAGATSFLLLGRSRVFTPAACFLWLFGAFNLLNGGYLIASALLGNGDWAAVIQGLDPPLLWRSALGVVGVVAYALGIRWTAASLGAFVERGEVAARDLGALVVPAYVAAGLLMTVAAVFNPIGPGLILTSGVGASFGLDAGLLFVPGMIGGRVPSGSRAGRPLPFSLAWVGLAIVTAVAFVGILGRGIRFGPGR